MERTFDEYNRKKAEVTSNLENKIRILWIFMERTFDEYNRKKAEVTSNLENYELIIDYYLKNPDRISSRNLKYAVGIITETEKLISSNISMYLENRAEEVESKVKELEFLIGKSFVGTDFEVESR